MNTMVRQFQFKDGYYYQFDYDSISGEGDPKMIQVLNFQH